MRKKPNIHIHVHLPDGVTTDQWEESKHPRAANGQFGHAQSEAKVAQLKRAAEQAEREHGESKTHQEKLDSKQRAENATKAYVRAKHEHEHEGKYGKGNGTKSSAGSAKHHNERATHHAQAALKAKKDGKFDLEAAHSDAAWWHREAAAALAAGKQGAAGAAMERARKLEERIAALGKGKS